MKSMLHEASSIMKAVEKAWNESGQPTEFTVKVLEAGEKGFLWFTKNPAIISLTFDPKKQPVPKKKAAPAPVKQNPQLRNKSQDQRNEPKREAFDTQRAPQPQRQQRPLGKEQAENPAQSGRTQEAMPTSWTPDFVDYISLCLRELIEVLHIDAQCTIKIDNKTLFLNFNKKLLPSPEEEKMLFISISYLLMQFLKKKYKKKLKGFHLVISSKESVSNDKQESGPTQR